MTWWNVIKVGKVKRKIKRKIKQMPEYEIVSEDKTRAHGGQIAFIETYPHEGHEKIHPHLLFPPSTPDNLDNYLRRLKTKMQAITRRGYRPKTGTISYDQYLKERGEA